MPTWTGRVSGLALWWRWALGFFVLYPHCLRLEIRRQRGLFLAASLLWCLFLESPQIASAASPLPLDHLLDCIEQAESSGVPYPDGAVTIEELPDGTHTIARGRYQIVETTWRMYSKLHVSYAAEPGRAKGVALLILMDCEKWYPGVSVKRIAFCYTAGRKAVPYKRKKKAEYAEKVSQCMGQLARAER